MGNQVKRKCPVCGLIYNADATRLKHGRQTTCSRACSYQLRASQLKQGQECQCAACGKVIYKSPSHSKKARHGDHFCSAKCAYSKRKRIVDRPYVLVAVVDYSANSKKAWETRRRNPKPYPDSARRKARARRVEQSNHGFAVSKFENEVAKVFRSLGFRIIHSHAIRNANGTFAAIYDICIPARNILIECHGTYWHGGRWSWLTPDSAQSRNLVYEERKLIIARNNGYSLRLLWEHHFKEDPTGACLAVVG